MFTTGSKFFLGATVVSVVAAVVYGASNGGGAGWLGTVGLLSAAFAFALLFAVNYLTRDSNVRATDPAVELCPAAQPPAGRSMWPLIGALGLGLLVVGAETKPIVFKAGVIALFAVAVEWMVQGWSERASADPAYNARIRRRILHPLELPVIGAVGLAVIIYSFSRIMLFLSKEDGPFGFIAVGAVVLTFGFLFAYRRGVKKGVIIGICAVGAIGLVTAGVAAAVDGQREIHEYPTTAADAERVCGLDEQAIEDSHDPELEEIDHRASQNVAAKSSVSAYVILEDGKLRLEIPGYPGGGPKVLTAPRSNPTNILFKNKDEGKHRLTAFGGTFTEDANGTTIKRERLTCTTLVRDDGEQLLTVSFPKSSAGADEPYQLYVPGVPGAEIPVVVP